MKEIALTPKTEEDLVAIWDYSFRQFGVVQADEYIGRIAAVFDVLKQRAGRTTILEPAMLTAINLDEFSGAGPTRS
ncbi:type II toxin-antitoxin system RelE/ParE family toxin [Klebsiella aerogenes]